MITDEQAEDAAKFIEEKAEQYANAKANRKYIEEFRKSQKSLLMAQAEGSDKTREAYAYAHAEYTSLIEGIKAAVQVEEKLRWQMVSAEHTIEIWRTQSANNRRLDSSHR